MRLPAKALLTPTSVPMMKTRIETRGCSLLPFIANFLYAASARLENRRHSKKTDTVVQLINTVRQLLRRSRCARVSFNSLELVRARSLRGPLRHGRRLFQSPGRRGEGPVRETYTWRPRSRHPPRSATVDCQPHPRARAPAPPGEGAPPPAVIRDH